MNLMGSGMGMPVAANPMQGMAGGQQTYNPYASAQMYGSSGYQTTNTGGTGTSPQDLINQYQQAYNQAKAANETRYNEILGGYRSRRDRALSDLAGSGDQERKDIAQEASNFEGRMGQDAVSRGLAGTSVLPAGKLAAAKFKVDATGRLDERLRQQRIALDSGLDQDTLQFMERRNDTYPDFEMLARLSQGMGGASGAGGLSISAGGHGGSGNGSNTQSPGSGYSDVWVKDPLTGKVRNTSAEGWDPTGKDREMAENIANAVKGGADPGQFASYGGKKWNNAGNAGISLPQLNPKYNAGGYTPKGTAPVPSAPTAYQSQRLTNRILPQSF